MGQLATSSRGSGPQGTQGEQLWFFSKGFKEPRRMPGQRPFTSLITWACAEGCPPGSKHL